jgi:hypothetical protein
MGLLHKLLAGRHARVRVALTPGPATPVTATTHISPEGSPLLTQRQYLADVPYVLPKDPLEDQRLNYQHHALYRTLSNNHYLAPLAPELELSAAGAPASHRPGAPASHPSPMEVHAMPLREHDARFAIGLDLLQVNAARPGPASKVLGLEVLLVTAPERHPLFLDHAPLIRQALEAERAGRLPLLPVGSAWPLRPAAPERRHP